MRARHLIVCLLLVVLAVQATGLYAQEDFPPETVDQIQAALDKQVEAANTVGITLLIDSPAGTFAGASGYADLENEVPLQPDDAFRIGSITKMFTSTVILQLAEEGLLSTDDTLAEWLPDITVPNNDRITLRHLMNHTSGIPNYTDDEDLIEQYLANPTDPQETETVMVDWLNALDTARFEPGEDWSYSNTNYILLGMVIETATGSTAAEQYRSRIFEPLGLAHTYLGDAEPATVELVQGYISENEKWTNTTAWNVRWAWTAGGLVSTPSDLAIFIRALFAGELFAQPDTLAVMLDTTGTGGRRYGLGIGYIPPAILGLGSMAEAAWGHDGGIPGYVTGLTYVPDLDLVTVTMRNSEEPVDTLRLIYWSLRAIRPALMELQPE
jgi:D-alanyl-D-alanine carboxypeptidase